MAGDAWFPLYTGDYLRDTMHLSTEEHGAYLLLLMSCWNADGEIDGDSEALASITRLPLDRWLTMSRKVLRFFYEVHGMLRHSRVDKEIARRKEKSRKASESAAKRWAEHAEEDAETDANAMRTQCEGICEGICEHDANGMLPQPQPQPQPELQPESEPEALREVPTAQSLTAHQFVLEAFNAVSPCRCLRLTTKRRQALSQRLRDASWDWRSAVERIPQSDFLSGRSGNWKGCHIDFFLRPDTVTRILEGQFDNNAPRAAKHGGRPTTSDRQFANYNPDKAPAVTDDEVPF